MEYDSYMLTGYDQNKLKRALENCPEAAAVYLFGSAAAGEATVNDLDLLALLHPGQDKAKAYYDMLYRIAKSMKIPETDLDILFFDVGEADPEILYQAVNSGILIKNESPQLLCDSIEELSRFLTENQPVRKRAEEFNRERLEDVCR